MVIKNGILVNADTMGKTDLRINAGIIDEIAADITPKPDEETIEAEGCYILPGGIDVHTHMDLDLGFTRATDDFYSGTVAAACGGTTTIVDHMAFGPRGCSLLHQVDHYHSLADGKAVIDYGFHGVAQHVDAAMLKQLPELIERGITSCKFYLTYDFRLEDDEVYRLMRGAREAGLFLCVHPENHQLVTFLRQQYRDNKCLSPRYHPLSRPPFCEAEAVTRLLIISDALEQAPLYIVHLSSAAALEAVRRRRAGGQKNIYVETCPQYLFLEQSLYERPDGLKYILSPPLRDESNSEPLWQALNSGEIDTVATDHCPFNYKIEKQQGKDDFSLCPNGIPGVELRLPLLLSRALTDQKIDLQTVVRTASSNPARLFGLYPQKGILQPDSDADLLLFNPNTESQINHSRLHENVDYTPYEGLPLKGKIEMVFSRGRLIVKDNEFSGQAGQGKYISRQLSAAVKKH